MEYCLSLPAMGALTLFLTQLCCSSYENSRNPSPDRQGGAEPAPLPYGRGPVQLFHALWCRLAAWTTPMKIPSWEGQKASAFGGGSFPSRKPTPAQPLQRRGIIFMLNASVANMRMSRIWLTSTKSDGSFFCNRTEYVKTSSKMAELDGG
ncbi:MAG: hypothetical protein DMG06_20795 [Acidobacteria bacterium]|nr:MAG: hypothetical protein DMG06_20795 [Acidobacteriota bacterium]